MEKTKAFFMGRFNPTHQGHVIAVLQLLDKYDEIVIGIGSKYEVGYLKHPYLSFEREKMLLISLYQAGVDMNRIKTVHLEDFPKNDERWVKNVYGALEKEHITCFCTGNEWVEEAFKKYCPNYNWEFRNPEKTSGKETHASHMRLAAIEGDMEKFQEIAAAGTLLMMSQTDGLNRIIEAAKEEARYQEEGRSFTTKFVSGRQTVDAVITTSVEKIDPRGKRYYENYVLCKWRGEDEVDFKNCYGLPGTEILNYENPLEACFRGIKEVYPDTKVSPSWRYTPNNFVTINTGKGAIAVNLQYLNLYSSTDEKVIGTRGGSSIAFYGHATLDPKINPEDLGFKRSDLIQNELAYQQNEMVEDTLKLVKIHRH